MTSSHDAGRRAQLHPAELETTRGIAVRKPAQSLGQVGGLLALEREVLLSLQRAAGNRAVCSLAQRYAAGPRSSSLQRKVKVDEVGPDWLIRKTLPKIPTSFNKTYKLSETHKMARDLAAQWLSDNTEEGRTFATTEAFYQAVFDQVSAPAQTGRQDKLEEKGQGRQKTKTPKQSKPNADPAIAVWDKIVAATEIEGTVTLLPWSSFSTDEGAALGAELLKCSVQVSSNPRTTACHGNDHKKLPKQVVVENFTKLSEVPTHEQPTHTDYIEFLVPGHKSTIGIERAILDKEDGLIYITKHYTEGSFVELSGAPDNLVQNWQAKAEAYCDILTGD